MSSEPLLSICPEVITFKVELEKQACYKFNVINNSEYYVAFKVETTSPNKYFVLPTMSAIQPWGTGIILTTIQAQKELPSNLECNDVFLVQNIKLPSDLIIPYNPSDMVNKDNNKEIEECKLRVFYNPRRSGSVKIEEKSEDNKMKDPNDKLRRSTSSRRYGSFLLNRL